MNRVIKIGKELVPVSEEIYKEYYKMGRRERYMENDIKVGSSEINKQTGTVVFKESKEDSIERLMEKGVDFADEQLVENIVSDKAMMFLLQEALKELDREEKELIDAIYFKKQTFRAVGEQLNISHVAAQKRHTKVLNKLRKFFT